MRHLYLITLFSIGSLYKKAKAATLTLALVFASLFAVSSHSFADDITLTVEVSGEGFDSVRLTGEFWGWDPTGGPEATDNGDGTWTVTMLAPAESMKYNWVKVSGDNSAVEAFAPEDTACTPVRGVDESGLVPAPYTNRVWVLTNPDNAATNDVYGSCAGHTPYTYDVTYSLEVPAGTTTVRMAGEYWPDDQDGWNLEGGPEAADLDGDNIWTVTLPAMSTNLEYLWVVDGDIEDLATQVDDTCDDTGLALSYDEDGTTVTSANRQWIFGDSPTVSETSNAFTCLDNPTVTFTVDMTGVDLGGEVPTLQANFLGWCGLCGNEMEPVDGRTDVYTLSLPIAPTITNGEIVSTPYEYKYAVGSWVAQEIVPDSCGTGGQYSNRTFDYAGVDLVLDEDIYNVCIVDSDEDGVDDHIDADDDNDFVEDINDPAPLDDEYFDNKMVTMSNVFGGNEHDEGYLYTAPAELSSPNVYDWAGFANSNESLYPLDFTNGGVISFVASVPSGEAVQVYFMLQDESSPNTTLTLDATYGISVDDDPDYELGGEDGDVVLDEDGNIVYGTYLNTEVSGSTPTKYSVDVPADPTELNNLIMDLEDNDISVKITDIAIGHTQTIKASGNASSVTISYDTSDDSLTNGLGLRVHFDSSVLTPTSTSGVLSEDLTSAPQISSPVSDTDNYDGMSVTDSYIDIEWSASSDSWPSGGSADLLTINFDVAETDATDAVIGFSGSSVASGYTLNAGRVLAEIQLGNWDIDDSGAADALTDGLLLLRYLFGIGGDALVLDATAPEANRTSASEVGEYIELIRPIADIDASGSADALTDGLLLLRYLFGIGGSALVLDATAPEATRTSASDIAAYIDANKPTATP